jgi:hypothetical protein
MEERKYNTAQQKADEIEYDIRSGAENWGS